MVHCNGVSIGNPPILILWDDHDDVTDPIPTSDMVTMGFRGRRSPALRRRRGGGGLARRIDIAASWSRVWSISCLMALGSRSTTCCPPSLPVAHAGLRVARRTTRSVTETTRPTPETKPAFTRPMPTATTCHSRLPEDAASSCTFYLAASTPDAPSRLHFATIWAISPLPLFNVVGISPTAGEACYVPL